MSVSSLSTVKLRQKAKKIKNKIKKSKAAAVVGMLGFRLQYLNTALTCIDVLFN